MGVVERCGVGMTERDQDGFAVPRRHGQDALFRHRGVTGFVITRKVLENKCYVKNKDDNELYL